jgi:circadian clock protein KaiC
MDKVGPAIRYVNLADDLRAAIFQRRAGTHHARGRGFRPGLVFVDSFRSVVQTARSGNEGLSDLQHFIQELGSRMATWQATTFLIGEYVADRRRGQSDHHGGRRHDRAVQSPRTTRRAQDPRRQDARPGPHGGRAQFAHHRRRHPRLSARAAAAGRGPPAGRAGRPRPAPHPDRRPGLDELLHGGLPQGHTMLVSGPTGSARPSSAPASCRPGRRQGEKGVAVFFEKGTSRLRNAELAEMVQAGHVTVVESRCSLSLTVELLDELCTAIERTGATRW